MSDPSAPDPRTLHYADFYGAASASGAGAPAPDDRPLLVVHGNCQAEALRVALATTADHVPAPGQRRGDMTAAGLEYRTVRIPAVHELTAGDIGHLRDLLGRAAVLVSQPIRDDYRGLPLGTAQVAAMLPAGGRLVRFPVTRYAGWHPAQVIVRHPSDMSASPAVVPYHDLRTVLLARRIERGEADAAAAAHDPWAAGWARDIAPDAVLRVAEASLAELRRREERDCDVACSDLFASGGESQPGDGRGDGGGGEDDGQGTAAHGGFGATTPTAHTINHPANAVLVGLARRVQDRLGWPRVADDPQRELLGGVRAPLEAPVIEAHRADASLVRDHWLVGGEEVVQLDVIRGQLAWYAEHPAWVEAALARHAATLETLGWA